MTDLLKAAYTKIKRKVKVRQSKGKEETSKATGL